MSTTDIATAKAIRPLLIAKTIAIAGFYLLPSAFCLLPSAIIYQGHSTATSLKSLICIGIAVARKIIILDFDKTSEIDLIGLAIAILLLAISYLVIKSVNIQKKS